MRGRYQSVLAAVLAALFLFVQAADLHAEEREEPPELYALSAVLMDGKTGRVLYGKEEETARPNASTTKVLTCILAIEHAPGDDYVQVSAKAAAQSEVKLGMQAGEQYYLEDLLYSLMLKSHNDSAVAIAEHIAGSTEKFALMMNEKAKKIGCTNTHFVTPNGLDAEDEGGIHHTTARDLALIMSYAIRNETFVHISGTRDYSFSDLSGKRQFSLHNANALPEMTDGVISGKTGFTGEAGYCYVCACDKDGKCLVVALLGCGWPNHKTYKWEDTLKLLAYGEEAFSYRTIPDKVELPEYLVKNGISEKQRFSSGVMTSLHIGRKEKEVTEKILIKKGESLGYKLELPEKLEAPFEQNQQVGVLKWYIGEKEWKSYPILTDRKIDEITMEWCVSVIFHEFFH